MKLRSLRLCLLCIFCTVAVTAFSLDREAFSFTKYDLDARVEPALQRLGVRGTITLRNDSQVPQKIAVLQISSSLDWRSIRSGGKQLQFVAQSYTSDIDHTGALSEAIVTLPEAVPPKGTVDLEIAYEGVIVLDATRLTRIDTPESIANSTDWDQISAKFTAVRGAGYVAWYPIATEAASLSEGTSAFDIVGRWKARETGSTMHLKVSVPSDDETEKPELLVNATTCPTALEVRHQFQADCTYRSLGMVVPMFLIADYEVVDRAAVAVHFLRGHDAAATNYGDAADKAAPFIADWFGKTRNKAQTADLADSNAPPFESGSLLLTPLTSTDPKLAGLAAAHQLTHAAFFSPRPWINEGLAHFAQAIYLEHLSGRQAAIDYMGLHRSALSAVEKEKENLTTTPRSDDEVRRSLVNTVDEELYRSKAMCVWWMLRDMVGEPALKKALASYRPDEDKEPSHMQRLIQAQTHKDLEWFFDDWVYHDRGLPEFKIESAFTRQTAPGAYILTITVNNLGAAGAEVPFTVKFAGGEVTQRLVVRGKSNGVIRVEVPKPPEEVSVNDGGVPESETTNHVFKIETSDASR
ncbi:MAG: M1 family aminopeptidase [Candidatus Sulfotelmatobacter sp.]